MSNVRELAIIGESDPKKLPGTKLGCGNLSAFIRTPL